MAINFNNSSSSNFDDTFLAKKTVLEDKKTEKVSAVPNPLFKFASYNVIFTLSALNRFEIADPGLLLSSKAHDIIIRSGGIGDPNATDGTLNAENKKAVQSPLAKEALRSAKAKLKEGRDLYFQRVQMNNIPGLNSQRRLTSVTNIDMTIVEPLGISLLEKIRGAAANNDFLDHIDAPYLLSMEFEGMDEFGNTITPKQAENLKRVIPIKLTNMELDVNQGGTTYTVKAIPFNQFPFVNRFTYLRTTGVINTGDTLSETMKNLQDIMNEQLRQESVQKFGEEGKEDTFQITIDESFASEVPSATNLGMGDIAIGGQNIDARERAILRKAGQVKQSDNLLTIITELMKSLPRFQNEFSLENFLKKIKGGGDENSMFFDYFFIDANAIPDNSRFDRIRGSHPKKIIYHVRPYKVHAYSLAEPGTSTGFTYENYVKKVYNYIFTGDNVDIIDLNINYKVAYFASKIKDIQGKSATDEFSKLGNDNTVSVTDPNSTNNFADPPFIHKSNAAVVTSVSAGVQKGNAGRLDQIIDALSNPTADMVTMNMTILGDPAYLGQGQFIPTNPDVKKPGLANDRNRSAFSGGREMWSTIFGNYNMDLGEPIIKLNFRAPTDLDDNKGVYELGKDEQVAFSGFYRVIQVDSVFEDGKFVQELQLVRANNQGPRPYAPTSKKVYGPHPYLDQSNKLLDTEGLQAKLTEEKNNALGRLMEKFDIRRFV